MSSYERLNRIGEGAYGTVYRAVDKQTNTLVALKKAREGTGDGGRGCSREGRRFRGLWPEKLADSYSRRTKRRLETKPYDSTRGALHEREPYDAAFKCCFGGSLELGVCVEYLTDPWVELKDVNNNQGPPETSFHVRQYCCSTVFSLFFCTLFWVKLVTTEIRFFALKSKKEKGTG